MAQVMQIHKVDNGYFIQTVEKEDSPLEGISIANNMAEVETLVHAKLCEIEGVQKSLEAQAPPKSEGVGIVAKAEGPPKDDRVEPPFQAPPAGDAYEAELRRLVTDNDRDAAHARLKAHVDADRLEPYKPRLGIKSLVDLIRQGDKLGGAGSEEGEALPDETVTTSGGKLPSGAPLPDGVPAPTGHDPFGAAPTRDEVQNALQEAAERTDVTTAFGVLKQLGVTKITELPEARYAEAIELANAL